MDSIDAFALGKEAGKKEAFEAWLKATGLDEYIAEQITRHEEQCHGFER